MTRRPVARTSATGTAAFGVVRPVALAVVAALAVAACGGGGAAQERPKAGTTFTYAITGLPTSLDPADYQGDPSRNIGFELGSSLFRWGTEGLPKQGCDALAKVDQIN